MSPTDKLPVSLLLLRIGVAAVMLPWAVDKLVRPEHAGVVFASFYGLADLGPGLFYLIGAVQLVIVAGFLFGLAKTWTYGLVLAMHAVSTLSTWRQYLDPFEGPNLLFFAAWPMLAACIALFLLRDQDRLWTVGR
jgi:putative oxidoreductase